MRVKKRVFLGLVCFSFLVAAGVLGTGAYLFLSGRDSFWRLLLGLVALGLLALVPLTFIGLGGMLMVLLSHRAFPSLRTWMNMATELLLPLAYGLGRLLRLDKEIIQASFIEVNNRLVKTGSHMVEPARILVLLPHCLQKADCRHKITMNLENCQRCGRCNVGDLISIKEELGVNLMVATGGTQARRMVKQFRPRAIVAVACERELATGIQDVPVMPVIGIPNQRPEGPCRNTRVDTGLVREWIAYFLAEEGLRGTGSA